MASKLSETQIENLIELAGELKQKLKKKNANLTVARQRLRKAKREIVRLQQIIEYQQKRIVELHPRQA